MNLGTGKTWSDVAAWLAEQSTTETYLLERIDNTDVYCIHFYEWMVGHKESFSSAVLQYVISVNRGKPLPMEEKVRKQFDLLISEGIMEIEDNNSVTLPMYYFDKVRERKQFHEL